jgi:hypothetical protein
MADAAIFIGWGPTVRGREQQALQLFDEVIQYYVGLQQQGEVESFEPVLLEAHGGDLNGFLLIRGDRDKLNRLRDSEEFLRFNSRAALTVENFGVVRAFIGEGLARQFALYREQLAGLG